MTAGRGKAAGKTAAKSGPRFIYDREASASVILAWLAEGGTLKSVCSQEGMPSHGTFLGWLLEDASLADRYTRARAIGLDAMADEIVEIANTPQIGTKTVSKATGLEITESDMIEHRRLQVDARKWLLAKMAPKKYGDRLAIGGSDDMPPVQSVLDVSGLSTDVLAAIMNARDASERG